MKIQIIALIIAFLILPSSGISKDKNVIPDVKRINYSWASERVHKPFWGISVALEIEGDIVFGAVYAPALDDYYMAQKGQGAWKNNQLINVSSEETLANAMITTGFACLRDYREDNNLDRFCRVARATTGQRRFGSAALDLCLVADGQVDAFWEQALNLYDIAAGALIAQEAGGSVTDFSGNPGVFPEQILVTNNKVLDQLLPLM